MTTQINWYVVALFFLCIVEYVGAVFCWMKWKKWEDAYWNNRHPRDTEMKKKTVCVPMFHAPKSER